MKHHVSGPSSAMINCCSFCYGSLFLQGINQCRNCSKRNYCSAECQANDWNQGHHRVFCGKAGENGHDFAIVDIIGKGKGMIALRDFHWGERIAIERMILSRPTYDSDFFLLSPNEQSAVMNLMSHDEDNDEEERDLYAEIHNYPLLDSKFDLNAIRCEPTQPGGQSISGLFIHLSRCNHECQPNAQLYYLEKYRVQVLIVCKPIINRGDEIIISYIRIDHDDDSIAMFILTKKWKFTCHCVACTDKESGIVLGASTISGTNGGTVVIPIREKMKEISRLNKSMLGLIREHQFDEAITIGEHVLCLYNTLACYSPVWYWKTHYDIFQIAAIREKTLSIAMRHIQTAMDLVKRYVDGTIAWPVVQSSMNCPILSSVEGDSSEDMMTVLVPESEKIKRYCVDPTYYPFYLWKKESILIYDASSDSE